MTMLLTLILLTVMVLGGLALARMSEIGTLANGNAAYREAAMQASEVGINTAYQAVRAVTNEELNAGSWYWALTQAQDANGLPNVTWSSAPEVVVGKYSVRYVVERACQGALPVTDALRQCLNKTISVGSTARPDAERLDPPAAKQFRITVRVTGPKDTQTWVQSLVTRG